MRYLAMINDQHNPKKLFTKTIEEAREWIEDNMEHYIYSVTTYILEVKEVTSYYEQNDRIVKSDITEDVLEWSNK